MSLPHVLLGLLTRGPASGWDLKTRLARDPSIGWDAELPQIYPALRRLLRGGFVALKRRRSTRGPTRREYRLTPAGRHELFEWLAEPPSIPRAKDAELTRLAFLERQAPEKRHERLRTYRALLAEALRRAAPGSTAARRRRRALLETELAWADAEMGLLAARLAPRKPREVSHLAREDSGARKAKGGPVGGERMSSPPCRIYPGVRLAKRATNFFRPARSK